MNRPINLRFPMPISTHHWLTILLILFSTTVIAQTDPATNSSTSQVTEEALKAKISTVEASSGKDEGSNKLLLDNYRAALNFLANASSNHTATEQFIQSTKQAPQQISQLNKKIEEQKSRSPQPSKASLKKHSLDELNQQLTTDKAAVAALNAKLTEFKQQLELLAARPKLARDRLMVVDQRQDKLGTTLKQPQEQQESAELAEATQWLLEAEIIALQAEVKMLNQELVSQPTRQALLSAQKEHAALEIEQRNGEVLLLQDLLNQRRTTEAEESRKKADSEQRKAIGKDPLIRQLAEQNSTLSATISTMALQIDQHSRDLDSAKQQTKLLKESFSDTRDKLKVASQSQVWGLVLQEQRQQLPTPGRYIRESQQREALIAELSLRQIKYREELRQLNKPDDYITTLTAQRSPAQVRAIRDDLKTLVVDRQSLIKQALSSNKESLQLLGEFEFTESQLADVVSDYRTFLDERLLWVRSAPAVNLTSIKVILPQLLQFLSPERWLEVSDILLSNTTDSPLPAVVLTLFLLALGCSGMVKNRLRRLGDKVGKPTTDRMSYTLQAVFFTLLLALPWPLLLAATGWQLELSSESNSFSKALGNALLWIDESFFHLLFIYWFCTPGGLAEKHFRWLDVTLQLLRRELRRLILIFLPVTFITKVVIYDQSAPSGGLDRLSLLVTLIALTIFIKHLFGAKPNVLHGHLTRYPKSPLHFWHKPLLWLVLSIPLLLIGLTLYGYLYTANTLTNHLIESLWLIFELILIRQLALRWLLITRAKIAIQAANERRAASDSAATASGSPQEGEHSIEPEEAVVDYAMLSQESRKLVSALLIMAGIVGLWGIWSSLLPALSIFDTVTLWHRTATVDGSPQLVPVTLTDLAITALIILVTVVTARRFPAFLEIILLRRFAMSTGNRYTVTTLTNYLIVMVGLILVFGRLGGNWGQIQWLVAALSVGIGFGLQEIIANFISGLIILFERPIRVGDTVTVGNTDGVVTRIRIRATTIRNWDKKELLVPNKEFITGQLLNWSLSDPVTRIMIPLRIAYGSDIDQVLKLLIQIANNDEKVMDDPAPNAFFTEYGESALVISLRCYTASVDDRVSTISRLLQTIDRRFKETGIEIPFPQQELHLVTK